MTQTPSQISQQGFPSIVRGSNTPQVRQQGINTTVATPAQTPVGTLPNRQGLGTGQAILDAVRNFAGTAANISARERADAEAKENMATASQKALAIRDAKIDLVKFRDQMIRGELIAAPGEDGEALVDRTLETASAGVGGPAYSQNYKDTIKAQFLDFTFQFQRAQQDKQFTEVRALLATTLDSLETDEDVAALLDNALEMRNFGQSDLEVFAEMLLPRAMAARPARAMSTAQKDSPNRWATTCRVSLPTSMTRRSAITAAGTWTAL